MGNDQSERAEATPARARWPSRSSQPHHWLLSGIRRPVGGAGPITSPAGEYSSFGRRPAPGPGSNLRQWYLLCAADRLPVEGVRCDGHLLWLHGPSALSRMGRRRGILAAMAGGAGTVRRIEGSGLELAKHGWGHDQIPPGRGGKPAPTPRTGVRLASNAVC